MSYLANYSTDRSDFRIVRGVQNEVLFRVRNLDRNPADTTTFQTVNITITDPETGTVLLVRPLVNYDVSTAIFMLTILAFETVDWATGPLRWSLTVVRSDGSAVMLWTDRNYGPYSTLEVSEGPIPGPQPLTVIPSAGFLMHSGIAYSGQMIGPAQVGYQNGMQSFAVYAVGFTGIVTIQGTLQLQPQMTDWFDITTLPLTTANGISLLNVQGNYLWLRVSIMTLSGYIQQVLVPGIGGNLFGGDVAESGSAQDVIPDIGGSLFGGDVSESDLTQDFSDGF